MDLLDLDLARVQAPSIMADDAMAAAATAAQVQLVAVSRLMDNVAIWARLDALTEPMLSTLAWQLHVDDFEGWSLAETDDQKRALIRESLLIHRYKGTRWSLERMFALLGMSGTVSEWFEYGGDPYRFRVDLALTRATDAVFPDKVLNLIDALKNVRSHLDQLRIVPTVTGGPKVASVSWAAAAVTVRPPLATEVTASGGPRIGVGSYAVATITLYPEA